VVAQKAMKKVALGLLVLLIGQAGASVEDRGAAPLPRLDHVFLIMMENRSYDKIMGSMDAPFINQLARSANLAANYFAVGHPSLTNYLEIVGGSNFGVTNDNSPNWHNAARSNGMVSPIAGIGTDAATPAAIAPFNSAIAAAPYTALTIADQLAAKGKSWKTYQESMPASGMVDSVNFSDGIYSNLSEAAIAGSGKPNKILQLYAVKHNPFVYFDHIQKDADPRNGLNNVADFSGISGLYADLRAGEAPNFSFIVPNQCHDMHGIDNGSPLCRNEATLLQMGDATVKQLVAAIKASKSWLEGKNAIIVMWDENDYSATPNQVVAIIDTNYGSRGVVSKQPYSHFSLLKTLEAGFDLPCLNHACDSNVSLMSDLFGVDAHH
jgi:phospholipase C